MFHVEHPFLCLLPGKPVKQSPLFPKEGQGEIILMTNNPPLSPFRKGGISLSPPPMFHVEHFTSFLFLRREFLRAKRQGPKGRDKQSRLCAVQGCLLRTAVRLGGYRRSLSASFARNKKRSLSASFMLTLISPWGLGKTRQDFFVLSLVLSLKQTPNRAERAKGFS